MTHCVRILPLNTMLTIFLVLCDGPSVIRPLFLASYGNRTLINSAPDQQRLDVTLRTYARNRSGLARPAFRRGYG